MAQFTLLSQTFIKQRLIQSVYLQYFNDCQPSSSKNEVMTSVIFSPGLLMQQWHVTSWNWYPSLRLRVVPTALCVLTLPPSCASLWTLGPVQWSGQSGLTSTVHPVSTLELVLTKGRTLHCMLLGAWSKLGLKLFAKLGAWSKPGLDIGLIWIWISLFARHIATLQWKWVLDRVLVRHLRAFFGHTLPKGGTCEFTRHVFNGLELNGYGYNCSMH